MQIEKRLANDLAKPSESAKMPIKSKNIDKKIYISSHRILEMRKYFANLSGAVKTKDIIKNFENWSEPTVVNCLAELVKANEIVRIKRGIYRRNLDNIKK